MEYESTRNSALKLSASQVMLAGLSPDGGLFIPHVIPDLFKNGAKWSSLDYLSCAKEILAAYLTDFTPQEIDECVRAAYSAERFDTPEIAKTVQLNDRLCSLELWHGPTSAFKDMALQLFPHLLVKARQKCNVKEHQLILVATSGDTGKAALEGFCDVEGTDIVVFYPENGVSEIQKLQMITQKGKNVHVFGVTGNFDDAQRGVKAIMTNPELVEKLKEKSISLSSANSINWGRLLPQIIYYVHAYSDMVNKGIITWGDRINVTVPTGNFGNILAAYLAKLSGLPIETLICASNKNNILTDFIKSGNYNTNRPFHKTTSPSMDILVSSNLERLLYLLSNRDSAKISRLMNELSTKGFYTLDNDLFTQVRGFFHGGFATDEEASETIKRIYEQYQYLIDPHTAVAIKVAEDYMKTNNRLPMLVASTASAYKFPHAVAQSLLPQVEGSDFELNNQVSAMTKTEIPSGLSKVSSLPVLHKEVCAPLDMPAIVERIAESL